MMEMLKVYAVVEDFKYNKGKKITKFKLFQTMQYILTYSSQFRICVFSYVKCGTL